ncbi:hypothetical protein, partial [Frisingicoccus caecimuris]|uniref:hypothetical protein n=1 Tax=Frisingicoccus caecimuris TaxID=1796636 RepID=UPI001A9ACBA8
SARIAGGLLFHRFSFFFPEKLKPVQQAKAHKNKTNRRKYCYLLRLFCIILASRLFVLPQSQNSISR